MGFMRRIRAWRRLRQRRLDCEILWPSLVAAAEGDIRRAQDGMLMHCLADRAWRDELSEIEIYRVIIRLTENESAGNRSPWRSPTPSKGS
jgi:hypothetical protein